MKTMTPIAIHDPRGARTLNDYNAGMALGLEGQPLPDDVSRAFEVGHQQGSEIWAAIREDGA